MWSSTLVDELGYLPFEPHAAHLFFQLVSRRYERGSILITSNRSVGEWGEVFGDAVVATAILDRLLTGSVMSMSVLPRCSQRAAKIEVAGLHRPRGAPAPSRATVALRSYVRRPQFAAALSTGSILSTAPASWSVVTYSRPSGPCFTSRIRWLSSVSSGM